jgi:phosphate transport system substrate-binding protein
MNVKVLIISLLVMSVVAAQCSLGSAPPGQGPGATPTAPAPTRPTGATLRFAGSSSMEPLVKKLAAAYARLHPDVTFDIQGGGSGAGVAAAGMGTADIGNVSRWVEGGEFKKFPYLQISTVAYDGLAIIVPAGLKLPGLTTQQARDIFAGEITNFSQVGGPDAKIITVVPEQGRGSRDAFDELVMTYREQGVKKQKKVVAAVTLAEGQEAVSQVVAKTPDSVGIASFSETNEGIRAVAIDGVEPTGDNVLNGSYTIFRPFNLVTDGPPQGTAKAFMDFAASKEGQSIVADYGIPGGSIKVAAARLQLAGSSTMEPLTLKLAEAYTKLHPDLAVDVQEGGSGLGIAVVGEGGVDIANVSRALTEADFQNFPSLKTVTVGYDGLAVVTNSDVKLRSLTMQQLRDIFAGEITNYSQVGGPDAPIVLLPIAQGSGSRDTFEQFVMTYYEDGEKKQKQVAEGPNIPSLSSSAEVKPAVVATRNSIGFISLGSVDKSVNPVPVDGVEPIPANVVNGTYVIFRPLNMVTDGAPSELAQGFLDFAMSPAGQAIVTETFVAALHQGGEPAAQPTATPVAPTGTPTAIPAPPSTQPPVGTETPIPPTETPVPPTGTPVPPTGTPVPPTGTPVISATATVPAALPGGATAPLTETPTPTN